MLALSTRMRSAVAQVVAVSLWSSTVWAAPAPDPAKEALGLLDQGVALYKKGDLLGARAAFARSRELVPDKPNPLRWLGLTDARLGKCVEAVGELEAFLRKIPPQDARAAEAQAVRDRCQEELRPKVGKLVVVSTPPGATVRLDEELDAAAGTTPYENAAIAPGPHVLFVELEGHVRAVKGFAAAAGATVQVEVTLAKIPEVPYGPALPQGSDGAAAVGDGGVAAEPADAGAIAPVPAVVKPAERTDRLLPIALAAQPVEDPVEPAPLPESSGVSGIWLAILGGGGLLAGIAIGIAIGMAVSANRGR